MDAWEKLAFIIPRKSYSNADLKLILREWRKLLNDCFTIPDEREMIYQVIFCTLQKLKTKSKSEETTLLLETLRFMLHKDYFDIDELNQFLVESNLQYHYVLIGNLSLQNGEFKSGYKKERKKKMNKKFDCVFVSHAYADREINNLFVDLLADIGLNQNQIFYSSLPEYGVDLGDNIADAIRIKLSGKKVHMIYMLSKNYYKSVMCLNEMGAAWILQHTYTSVLLPGFRYRKIEGAVDPGNLGIKLSGNEGELKAQLIRLRNQLQKEFCLPPIDEIMWNRKVDNFLSTVKEKTDR